MDLKIRKFLEGKMGINGSFDLSRYAYPRTF